MSVVRLRNLSTDTALAKAIGVTAAGAAAGRDNDDAMADLLATAGVPAAIGVGATFLPAGTGAEARTLQSKLREFVSVLDFIPVAEHAAIANGTTTYNATASINEALLAGSRVYVPPGTYRIGYINVQSNQILFGAGETSVITGIDGDSDVVDLSARSNTTIENIKIRHAVAGTSSSVGLVRLYNSSHCTIRNCFFSDASCHGIYMHDANDCTIHANRFSSTRTTAQNSGDIKMLRNCNRNDIGFNHCHSGNSIGIQLQDDNVEEVYPYGNNIHDNWVSGCVDYGIMLYLYNLYDTKSKILNNYVWNIAGSRDGTGGKPFGGAIYIQSAGGTICKGNHCWDFCQQTTNISTLAPAGVGVTNILTGCAPVTVSENHIRADRGPGILVNTSEIPVKIHDNTIEIVSTSNTALGKGIAVTNANGCQVKGNTVIQKNTNYESIVFSAGGIDLSDISVDNNLVDTVALGIYLDGLSNNIIRASVAGNDVHGGTSLALLFSKVSKLVVADNILQGSGALVQIGNCPAARVSGTRFISSWGGGALILAGTGNTGSVIDESCVIECPIENNAGNGFIIVAYGTSAPALSGLHDVGERVINTAATVGQPKAWQCTTAGNPGTWTSEGNL